MARQSAAPAPKSPPCPLRPAAGLLLALLATAGTAAAAGAAVTELPGAVCNGYTEEWGTCPDLEPCHVCEPVNCSFTAWADWSPAGGCTQVAFRRREIKVQNNECGTPCLGARTETRRERAPSSCRLTVQDCRLSDWSNWTACRSPTDQRHRSRLLMAPPLNGGEPCPEDLGETEPCGRGPEPEPCRLAPWGDWTACSASCDEGRRSRARGPATAARFGGEACAGATLESATCDAGRCPSRDCTVSDWSDWSFCSLPSSQRYRDRDVVHPALGDGKDCPKALRETAGCHQEAPVDCELSGWSRWSVCDKACGGGQAFRSRTVKAPMQDGGSCPDSTLRETRPCNTQLCTEPPVDCRLSDWAEWSSCSAKCGEGSRERKRTVSRRAAHGGRGCEGRLAESAPCEAEPCEVVDCEWGPWYDWSPCTRSCGSGSHHRSRTVVTPPRHGGRLCEAAARAEVALCNSELCPDPCVDARWGEWGNWTACSATCGVGYRSRHRSLAREANFCGRPAAGVGAQFEACHDLPACEEAHDCRLSEWGEWSYCSASCFGLRERYRVVARPASAGGAPCAEEALKEVGPCNAAAAAAAACRPAPPEDCELSPWSSWGNCSSSCGGGQRERRRRVVTEPSGGGRPCQGGLVVTAACATQPCEPGETCQDCLWAAWSDWGDCSARAADGGHGAGGTAGGGQRWRHRAIRRMPNFCGRGCGVRAVSEVSNCTARSAEQKFCAWSPWSDARDGGCDGGGDDGRVGRIRRRTLEIASSRDGGGLLAPAAALARGGDGGDGGGGECGGVVQEGAVRCARLKVGKPCEPVHAEFGEWQDWGPPACKGSGLCERRRVVEKLNNECGEPPAGPLQQTKPCDHLCRPSLACRLSPWAEWTPCPSPSAQRFRARAVERAPANGGRPCQGALNETGSCSAPCPWTPCAVSAWSAWGTCSRTCGGGWQTRSRHILSRARCGGSLCEEPLEEAQACGAGPCDAGLPTVDCLWDLWSPWSGCGVDGQRYRERKIRTMADGGAPCVGNLQETGTCMPDPVDCEMSDWTDWDSCNRDCGFGQQTRQRQIHRYPQHGGQPCAGSAAAAGAAAATASGVLAETRGCSVGPCSAEDCTLSAWSEWGACSVSCGVGQQSRQRSVAHARDFRGEGCAASLAQTRVCPVNPPCAVVDGLWGPWSAWSGCTRTCAGGQMERSREIAVMPVNGGAPVEGDDEEVVPCNTQPCLDSTCRNGAWQDWQPWSPCSQTCGTGVAFRRRKVAVMANVCGLPATGKDTETVFCNMETACEPAVDCLFTQWSVWGDCSTTCNGVKHRSRSISRYGRGTGAYCTGGLKQTAPCNSGESELAACDWRPPTDCRLSGWSAWSSCTASCGGGSKTRSREVVQPPVSGGLACKGPILEVEECSRHQCVGTEPVDCVLGAWEDWAPCSKCGGQRKRFRHIAVHAANGGETCDAFAREETAACPEGCGHEALFCAWSLWLDWSPCSASCGAGRRSRRRHLEPSASPEAMPGAFADEELVLKYAAAHERRRLLQSHRFQGIVAAFACGALSFGVAQIALRLSSGVAAWRRRRREQALLGGGPSSAAAAAASLGGGGGGRRAGRYQQVVQGGEELLGIE